MTPTPPHTHTLLPPPTTDVSAPRGDDNISKNVLTHFWKNTRSSGIPKAKTRCSAPVTHVHFTHSDTEVLCLQVGINLKEKKKTRIRLRCFTAAYLLIFTSASNWSASHSSPLPSRSPLCHTLRNQVLFKDLEDVRTSCCDTTRSHFQVDQEALRLRSPDSCGQPARRCRGRTVGSRAVLQLERASGTPSLAVVTELTQQAWMQTTHVVMLRKRP